MSSTFQTSAPVAGPNPMAPYLKYSNLFKNVMIGIIVLNQENKIYYSNSFAANLFGYSTYELVGKPVELLIHTKFHKQFEIYRQRFYFKPPVYGMDKRLILGSLRKDGTEFPVELNLTHYEIIEKELSVEFLSEITIKRKERQILL